MTTTIRPLAPDDDEAFTRLAVRNRAFMRPYEPVRGPEHFTLAGQRARIASLLGQQERGDAAPFAIIDEGAVVGALTLNRLFLGPFRSCGMGYWVDQDAGGRGLATRAVAEAVEYAFTTLDLHRVEAATLVDNPRSQRVLQANDFTRIGVAPRYLHIDGRWRDHVLFQRTGT